MSSAVRDRLRMIQLRQAEQARGGAACGGALVGGAFRLPASLKKLGRDVAHQTLRNVAPGHASYIEEQANIRKRLNKQNKAIPTRNAALYAEQAMHEAATNQAIADEQLQNAMMQAELYTAQNTYPDTYYTETDPNSDLIDLTGFGRRRHRRGGALVGGALVGGVRNNWTKFLKEHLSTEIAFVKQDLPPGTSGIAIRNAAIRILSDRYHSRPERLPSEVAGTNPNSKYKQRKAKHLARQYANYNEYYENPIELEYRPPARKSTVPDYTLELLKAVDKIPVEDRSYAINDAVLTIQREAEIQASLGAGRRRRHNRF